MSRFRESLLTVYIHEQIEKPHIVWRNVCVWGGGGRGHIPAVGMRSDFELRDLLKPHFSPALPLTGKWTRVLAGQIWTRDLWSLTYLPSTEKANAGLDKTIGRCTNERSKTMPKAWGKSLPEDLTTTDTCKECIQYFNIRTQCNWIEFWKRKTLDNKTVIRRFSMYNVVLLYIFTHFYPMGSPNCKTRINIPQYYKLKHLIRYMQHENVNFIFSC